MKTKVITRENGIIRTFKAGFIALFITVAFMALLSTIIYFTDVSDKFISNSAASVKYISAALMGFLCGRGAHGRGFVCGAAASAVYMAVLCLAGIMVSGGISDGSFIRYILTGSLIGAIGGVVGINCR